MAKNSMYRKYEWPESQMILALDDEKKSELGIEPADNMACFVPVENVSEVNSIIHQFDTKVC